MTTASNLLFQVAGNTLYAYKADTGDELLALPFNLGGGAPPITYMVDNTQYVGFATGTQFMAMKVGGTEKMPDAPLRAAVSGAAEAAPRLRRLLLRLLLRMHRMARTPNS